MNAQETGQGWPAFSLRFNEKYGRSQTGFRPMILSQITVCNITKETSALISTDTFPISYTYSVKLIEHDTELSGSSKTNKRVHK